MTSEEEAAVWEALPKEEHKSVWDETERNFWTNFKRTQEEERTFAQQEYNKAVTEIKVELGTLTGRRTQLSETQVRLAKELAQVEEELARVVQECDEKANKLQSIEQEHAKKVHAQLETRDTIYKTMKTFFRGKRGKSPEGEGRDDFDLNAIAGSEAALPIRAGVNGDTTIDGSADDAPVEDTSMEGVEYQNTNEEANKGAGADNEDGTVTLVDVVDADGNTIGPVKKIDPWNQWVEAILDYDIRRPVKIRRGRRFNESHLATIYERTEAKGVKWLSCMIQATGEVQTKRCQSCDKNQGAFDDCIIVGGELFQKCGNCEWNRQGCHGASGDTVESSGRRRSRKLRDSRDLREAPESIPEVPEEEEDQAMSGVEKAPVAIEKPPSPSPAPVRAQAPPQVMIGPPLAPAPAPKLRALESADALPAAKEAPAVSEGSAVAEPEQMPTPREYQVSTGFTPANTRSRPPSADRPTPTSLPIEPSPQPTDSGAEEQIEEITRENLILRHNGSTYVYPECVVGVPLVKIDENHPYWEPNWQNVRTLIEPQLARWREKHQAAIDAGPKLEKGGSSKYQIGRQVNRGLKILEFLEEGDISPYQLLGKQYIQSGKGGVCSYDTLFRLSESLSELSKFKLDITPVEWIRHRLWELMQSEGSSFNLPRTIHDFYHDKKLTHLRYKHGFKNIGRPSGLKTGRQSLGSPNATPRVPKKRKSTHSLVNTPQDVDQSPLATQMSVPPSTSFTTHLHKRPKLLSPTTGPIHDEFRTTDYSDADSWSGAEISTSDFRLYQVKTRLYTSSDQVTQYWSWLEPEQCFEHQVLKDVNPVSWGLHKDPIDFHLNIDEIAEIVWNIEALRIHVIMRKDGTVVARNDGEPRGDVMAAFKRERTMRRFLRFCRDLNIKMVKEST